MPLTEESATRKNLSVNNAVISAIGALLREELQKRTSSHAWHGEVEVKATIVAGEIREYFVGYKNRTKVR